MSRCDLGLGLAVGTILIVDLNLNLDLDLGIGFEIDVDGVVNIFSSYWLDVFSYLSTFLSQVSLLSSSVVKFSKIKDIIYQRRK